MEFRFTAEQEAFREEVRGFLSAEWKGGRGGGEFGDDESFAKAHEFEKKLADKGWLTMAWPKEYGGLGANQLTQLIFREECAKVGAPGGYSQGISMIGPCLMVHGTDAQKKRFLPKIGNAEEVWCQGFSEPGAGSDLAGLQTRAERDGDDYVINGTKIWTSGAQHSDFIHILTRTDPSAPKHRGITYFLLDMRTPGIKAQPLQQITGRSGFCQTFFDNVRVPRQNIVGGPEAENRGWYQATTTLDFERSSISRVASCADIIQKLKRYANQKVDGRRAIDDPVFRSALADLAVSAEVGRWLAYRVAWMQSRGLVPNYEASMSKLYNASLLSRMANLTVNLIGLHGQLREDSPHARLSGLAVNEYLGSVCTTVSGGSNEIQRGIIATRGLGMPRG